MKYFQNIRLNLDKEFKALVIPLSSDEYSELEDNLIKKGCCDPIFVWKGVIVDGHNRYEICNRHKIPFKIQYIDFNNRNEAVAWICVKQLERISISESARRYLIGKRYEADSNRKKTALRLGEEYGLSHITIAKYAAYTRAIDTLTIKDREFVSNILSGQVKVSHENVIGLSRLPAKDFKCISKQIIEDAHRSLPPVSVKDMPEFDPDAEISSLTLTIPSWISSIRRAQSEADFRFVSDTAKNKLINMLRELIEATDTILCITKEQ